MNDDDELYEPHTINDDLLDEEDFEEEESY